MVDNFLSNKKPNLYEILIFNSLSSPSYAFFTM